MLEYTLVLVSAAVPPMKSPPPCKPKTEHVTFQRGDGTLHVGSIRGKAHPLCHRTHIAKGAMDESSGKGSKMQAHISSGVVMDIAAFKVSHSVGVDQDATALQAKKWSA